MGEGARESIFSNHSHPNQPLLHGSPMSWLIRPILVSCPIITPTFIGLRKHLVIGQLNEYQFFSAFHWSNSDTPPASQCITVQ